MDIQLITTFLRRIAEHNDRAWFAAHKDEYAAACGEFERGVAAAIARISTFDPSVAHITVKDATYRFYRDTRFSKDKAPYKRHFGAYIAAHGKKAMHGGYYIHIEPGHCMLCIGNYELPTNVLTACRSEIEGNSAEWLRCVTSDEFVTFFSSSGETAGCDDARGFGLQRLKTCPAGFSRESKMLGYLRMKDYCCWHAVPDTFFSGEWLDGMERVFRAGKPMMDFINAVVDDYE